MLKKILVIASLLTIILLAFWWDAMKAQAQAMSPPPSSITTAGDAHPTTHLFNGVVPLPPKFTSVQFIDVDFTDYPRDLRVSTGQVIVFISRQSSPLTSITLENSDNGATLLAGPLSQVDDAPVGYVIIDAYKVWRSGQGTFTITQTTPNGLVALDPVKMTVQ